MKSHHPKLRTTTPRPLFSCGFFRQCTQTALSPTTSSSPTLPLSLSHPPPPPVSDQLSSPPTTLPPKQPDPESSSSSNASQQSFTQWRFPLPNLSTQFDPPKPKPSPSVTPPGNARYPEHPRPPPLTAAILRELFHVSELQFGTGSESDRIRALYMLEQSLVPNPTADADGSDFVLCPEPVMRGVVGYLKDLTGQNRQVRFSWRSLSWRVTDTWRSRRVRLGSSWRHSRTWMWGRRGGRWRRWSCCARWRREPGR